MDDKILFDWDNPNISGSYAIKKGIKLITYGILKGLKLNKFLPKEIVNETDDYAKMILQINDMLGVTTIIGIKDNVKEVKSETINYMINKRYDVRKHIHIGDNLCSDRKRLWEPPLNQSMDSWHFDSDYANGKKVELKKGELPIWHFDNPHYIKHYIDFLYHNFF